MKEVLVILLLVQAAGCIGVSQDGATTLTQEPSTTSSLTIPLIPTTSLQLWTITLPDVPPSSTTLPIPVVRSGCGALNSSFWRALCFDSSAYAANDSSLCGTFYCRARFFGQDECSRVRTNASDWVGYKSRACEAWAARRPFMCDSIAQSDECIRWYALLEGDLALCLSAEKRGIDDCIGDFAFWRGNMSVCKNYKSRENSLACEAGYFRMQALDNHDASFCDGVKAPRARVVCSSGGDYAGEADKHPLYGMAQQLIL